MRNTSESPEGNEQVTKPATTRSRSTARTKAEKATTGSSEQETKPTTTRRRSAPAAATDTNTTGNTLQNGVESSSVTSTPAASTSVVTTRPAPKARTPRSSTTAQQENDAATTQPVRTTKPSTPSASPAPSVATPKRAGGTSTEGPVTPTQRPAPRPRTQGTPAPAQNTSSAGSTAPPRPRTGAPNQRPAGTNSTSGYSTGTQPRPTTNRYGNQTNYPSTPGQTRSGGPSTGQMRSGGPLTGQTRSGGTTTGPARPGGGTATGPARPGGTTRPGTTRPGGPTRGGANRSGGGRPGTPATRPQERRTPVVKEKPTGPISIPPQIVVKDLAELLQATPNEIIRGLIKHKIFASINQVVDYDKAALVAQELGFEPSQSTITATPTVQNGGVSANETMMATRNEDDTIIIPPVVTIMGHVDHGKTSLLDTIRKTKVAAGEAGGITQHIGAYQVEVNGKKITFLDTPGHEAFTAMRARGAQVTHIAIIVVAADDGVMPQTREAISHAQAAKVPIIIALNKIDRPNANPDLVKQQLAEIGVIIEEYGGDVVCVPVSARQNIGIDELLEMILLVAEVQDIRANPNRPAIGVIIEAKLEKNTGAMATVLIQQGTLKMGDNIVVGHLAGKVRAMFNDRGKRIQKAPPSTPVSILGLPEVPNAGDRLEVMPDERAAKQAAQKVAEQRRSVSMPLGQVSLDTLYMQMQEGTVKELNVVLKCDVQGSAEAIKNALSKVGEENIKVRLIHEGIGNINETDVHLAAASEAVIIGFNVKADGAAQRQAQKEGVDIRYYNVIYKLIDDIQAALTGMLEPTFREVIEGHAEVVQIFKAGKNIVIAGCRVTDGKLSRSSRARVMRDGTKVFEGLIGSIRRGKDDVREIASGYECGIILEDFTAFEVGDIIEAFFQERVKTGA